MPAWVISGEVLALVTAVIALVRARRAHGSYYAADVYGMTPATHRRYAAISLLLALGFAAALFVPAVPAVLLLAVQTLVSVFYGASFLRGFSDEE